MVRNTSNYTNLFALCDFPMAFDLLEVRVTIQTVNSLNIY